MGVEEVSDPFLGAQAHSQVTACSSGQLGGGKMVSKRPSRTSDGSKSGWTYHLGPVG